MRSARTFALAAALAGASLVGACKKEPPEKVVRKPHTPKPGAVQQAGAATAVADTTRVAKTAVPAGKAAPGKTGAKQQPGGIAPSNVPASKVPVSTPPASKVPPSRVPVSTPPVNAGVAAKGPTAPTRATANAAPTTPTVAAPGNAPARDTTKGMKAPVKANADSAVNQPILRESFTYDASGRRDPFASLMTTSELRPAISDLRLTGILYDPTGRRPIAIMRDQQTQAQYRVTTGMTLGRMRVAQIKPHSVIFTIEEFGMNRQDSLVLGDSSKVRNP